MSHACPIHHDRMPTPCLPCLPFLDPPHHLHHTECDALLRDAVCADLRGSTVFLFGLRVRADARGRGLAKQLMAHACAQTPAALAKAATTSMQTATASAVGDAVDAASLHASRNAASVAALMSVTVSYNVPAQHVLASQLEGPLAKVREPL